MRLTLYVLLTLLRNSKPLARSWNLGFPVVPIKPRAVRAEERLRDSGLVARGAVLQGSHFIFSAGPSGDLSAEGAPRP